MLAFIFMLAKVWRERTFFLLTRSGWDFFAGLESVLAPSLQMKQSPKTNWHPESKPVLSKWLSSEQTALDKQRLNQVGNLVMPDVARMAINMMAVTQ